MRKKLLKQQFLLVLLTMLIAIPQGVWAEDYPITVAGVQVTSENAWNVLGDQETPTVVFTPADDTNPATLTLHSATIDMSDTDGYAVESSIANLTVRFEFENTIKVWTDKPYAFKYSGTGTGSLTFVSELDENYATLYGWLQVNGISEFGSVASGNQIAVRHFANGGNDDAGTETRNRSPSPP